MTPMRPITPKQLAVVRFVRDFVAQHHYGPTLQEIGDHFGRSKVTMFECVEACLRKGALVRIGKTGTSRCLRYNEASGVLEPLPTDTTALIERIINVLIDDVPPSERGIRYERAREIVRDAVRGQGA